MLRLFHFLAELLHTTSEIELGYYHRKMNVPVAERLKTYDFKKLGDFKKIPKTLGFDRECPAGPQKPNFNVFRQKSTNYQSY